MYTNLRRINQGYGRKIRRSLQDELKELGVFRDRNIVSARSDRTRELIEEEFRGNRRRYEANSKDMEEDYRQMLRKVQAKIDDCRKMRFQTVVLMSDFGSIEKKVQNDLNRLSLDVREAAKERLHELDKIIYLKKVKLFMICAEKKMRLEACLVRGIKGDIAAPNMSLESMC